MQVHDENAVNTQGKALKAGGKTKSIEEIYTKKTQLEHILLRPDTYIGSVEKQTQFLWVFDSNSRRIVNKSVTFVPGLFKIFDEIIVNAADNKQRDATMNRIDVTIDPASNCIRVWNNGNGIPIVMHQEHKIYVPELIFGHLLTGSNFDDNEAKTTGGRNGYGAKLANIFSKQFIVETADSSRSMKYRQVFQNNMSVRGEPEVTKYSGTDYTCITFYPDLTRFKMGILDDDIVAILSKRVHDLAGTMIAGGSRLNVYLNDTKLEVKNFETYMSLYDGIEAPCAFEKVNDRWEIGVGVSDGSFQQVSFVNSICTSKGGVHVNYIADQITSRLVAVVKKRSKGEDIKPNQIKNHIAIYVNALVVNPSFDSQTKEFLTTKASNFGSTCVIPEKMMKAIEKSSIVDNVLNWAKYKQTAELKKKNGTKKSKILGITKLDDANFAGSAKSRDCTLILTEGDSAKALAISGLSVVGRDYFGVFPLKGKLLNVREASHAQIMKNEEIQNLVKILGLNFGKVYEETSSLRYGHLMIMTDQDHDGSHIKGLLINFIHHFWPSLLKIDGFLQQFITPIVKCSKGKTEQTFFTLPEYQNWKMQNNEGKGWKIKYYKGLGTSTSQEAKDYFSNIGTHKIDFEWDNNADNVIDMAFAKKRVDDRKFWLLTLEPGIHIDYDVERINYDDFVNKELILFSHADNERSIPSIMDGFKPSQRKVLFGCFKRNLKNEIKVAQLAGYISEHAAYHHGEASLTQTIIGMAQNFIGSNNVNLLSPCGQFGTRLMGGKDAASPRYVFTKLENIARSIFHPDDDPLLNYLDDDGQSIEPEYYVPVIPMVLVNGCEGIGTGWSTSIPAYNPRDIISNIRSMLCGESPNEMTPWYRGFGGEIIAKGGKDIGNFTVSGRAELINDSTVVVSELPVGKWTTDYKQMIESVLIGNTEAKKEEGATVVPAFIKDFKENHTDTSVLFTLTIPSEKIQEINQERGGLQKKLKLDSSISTSNMHMFNTHGVIKKYETPLEVLLTFYDVRISFYKKRKAYLEEKLNNEWDKLDNKVRFIRAVIDGRIVVSNRKKNDLLQDLKRMGFKVFLDNKPSNENLEDEEEISQSDLDRGYDYLLSMKIWSLTNERIVELTRQRDEKNKELNSLQAKSPEDLWIDDLDNLEASLDEFDAQFAEAERHEEMSRRKVANSKGARKGKRDYDSDEELGSDDSDFDGKKKKKKAPVAAKTSMAVVPGKGVNVKELCQFKEPAPREPKEKESTRPVLAEISANGDEPAKAAVKLSVKPRAAPTAKAPKAPKAATNVVDDDDDVLPQQTLSLFERLKLAASTSTSSTISSFATTKEDTFKIQSVPLTSAPAKKAAATKKTAKPKKVDSEDEAEFSDEQAEAAPRAKRAISTKATYVMDSDEEDKFIASEDESEADFESESASDEDDEFESDDDKPKKKSVPVAKQSAKPLKVPAAKAAPAPKAVSVPKAAATISVDTGKGIKRSKKGTERSDAAIGIYSPGVPTPQPKKKSRKVTNDSDSEVEKPKKAAKKPITIAAAPAAKKAAPKKKTASWSDDEGEENSDDSSVQVVKRTPKPSRSRQAVSYATYVDSGSDEEEEFDESD